MKSVFNKAGFALVRFLSISVILSLFIFSEISAVTGFAERLSQTRKSSANTKQKVKPEQKSSKQTDSANAVSTADRSALPLADALIGHWIIEKRTSKTHYYYSKGKFLSVFGGQVHEGKYTVEEVNEEARSLRVRISSAHSRILTFSPDKKEISDIAEVAGHKAEEALVWKYLDDGIEPSLDVVKSTITNEPIFQMTTAQPEKPEFIIGDRKTKIYYWKDCPEYQSLPIERRTYFKNRKDAERSGYRAAKDCK